MSPSTSFQVPRGAAWRLIRLRSTISLVRAAGSRADGPPIYVRVHDSASAVSLNDGAEILDRKRPDRVPPPRRPVPQVRGLPAADPREGEELHRGASLMGSRTILGSDAPTTTPDLQKRFLALGIRGALAEDGDTIRHLAYIQPYPRKVCGVWLGASAADVQEILGVVEDETTMGRRSRFWIYELRGHLGIGFDETDRENVIVR